MRAKFMREVALAGLPPGPDPGPVVSDADLAALPEPARRYLGFMGVVGRPRDSSFRLAYAGRFRRTPREAWMTCEAWQYNSRPAVARLFHMRARLAGLVPVLARDTYVDGHGRMLVRALDLFTVADGRGEEFDIGELVTYLNDAVLIAPSMLLAPAVTFSPAASDSFDLALVDRGHRVTARVLVDEHGRPLDFSTTDRFCVDPDDPKRLLRMRWTTPIEGWGEIDGRELPIRAQAVWHLPAGDFVYADFSSLPETLAFNVPPGE